MSVFDDLGVMVDGLEDDTAEEFDGDVEEIFRFNVFLTKEQEMQLFVQQNGINVTLAYQSRNKFGVSYGNHSAEATL